MAEPTAGTMVTSNVRLLRPLGEGGMGAVWLAEHRSLRTHVVVKFMAEGLAESPEAKARFSREAAAASQVKSPHVVQMLDHGVLESGAPYIVMELLEGRDLDQQMKLGRLEPRQVVGVVAQLARALGRAHERGIVHRDIKPSNVFLCDAGGGELFVKLLDFGIAKGQELGIVGSTTQTGSFIGSPYYMSPEQVVGAKDIDFRTDLWSLGVVAFEALTGQKPFQAETVGALALKIHRDPLPLPSSIDGAIGGAVDAWFAHACAREANARFPSAKEMAEALALAVTGEPMPLGLRVDALAAPESVVPKAEAGARPSGHPSGVDARSETGAGVGFVATDRRPMSSRSKAMAVGGIALVSLGLGFMVPKWMGSGERPAAVSPEPMAASARGTTLSVPSFPTTAASVLAPEAPAVSSEPATAVSAPSKPNVATAGTARPSPSVRPRSTASIPAPSIAAPSAAAPVTKPPHGSDDDIK